MKVVPPVICAMVLLMGCAQSARDLPPHMGELPIQQRLLPEDRLAPEFAMSCEGLHRRRDEFQLEQQLIAQELQGVQSRNQNIAIASVLLFHPLMAVMDPALPLRARQNQLDIDMERATRIATARGCSYR